MAAVLHTRSGSGYTRRSPDDKMLHMTTRIHPLAQVAATQIGADTVIWQFAVVLAGARIGRNCNINCHTFIEDDVVIGDNVTVKSGVYLWNGLRVADDVFIGPNATFVNDLNPRSKRYPDQFHGVKLEQGASIGANATIVGGLTIGRGALVGAGSVVTRDVAPQALVVGNPARQVGWVDAAGKRLRAVADDVFESEDGSRYRVIAGRLTLT